jgi:hypothetical protein
VTAWLFANQAELGHQAADLESINRFAENL